MERKKNDFREIMVYNLGDLGEKPNYFRDLGSKGIYFQGAGENFLEIW